MTGILLSAVGVLFLTLVAWAMGFSNAPALSAAEAAEEAEGRLPGFRAAEAWLAAGGRGALVAGRDGTIAVILPLGDGWLVRRIDRRKLAPSGDGMVHIRLDEPMLREAKLACDGSLPAWARS